MTNRFIVICFLLFVCTSQAQSLRWSADGNSYFEAENGEIVRYTLPGQVRSVFVSAQDLIPSGTTQPIDVRDFHFSEDGNLLLVYTHSRRVWRLDTEGDYWVLDTRTKKLQQVGKSHPASSLRFAKLSPDGKKIAYVSEYDLYIEDLATGKEMAVTANHSRKIISGTFDWVYEEEFSCRDGFQWSPDSKQISYWQLDAAKIKDYYMLNTTDSAYSHIIPVEYPTIGQSPSPAKIGIVNVSSGQTTWLNLPGDPQQHYLPRMEWNSPSEIFIQQLNRKQNQSKIFSCSLTGSAKLIYEETDRAWIDVYPFSGDSYSLDFRHEFIWLNHKKEFLWMSDKDGWVHLYRIASDGSKETLITKGNFDVIEFLGLSEKDNAIYFLASPTQATQKYLFKASLDGKGKPELVSPTNQIGTHGYTISPNGKYAQHTFSNYFTKPAEEWITLSGHQVIGKEHPVAAAVAVADKSKSTIEFFKIKTEDGIEMDGWMAKPREFDPHKKYPVLFYVYTEPASQTVTDSYGTGWNPLFNGSLAKEGYLYISVDGRGTPAPKGKEWRKSIYRKIGRLNIHDQAMAAKEILKWPFVDADRVAVWGWSGGGSTTLNLLFQYPEIYKTGIAIAAVANQLTYDNIYQERYMGLPQENLEDIVNGSPVTYAKNLKGNLLYIHGTGDDNVHYNNAEMLLNELIKYNKQFRFMPYPNRTHGISEGEGTRQHLSTLYSEYLRSNCPPGGR
ncbi:MAG: DPP IV N-terminal domain-containing protein [Bacteroidetes bacterium]|nr:DPP IV N-terminal domain-containing protein [Bacteroidota bacterium]MBS1540958.1 DPP IV N-terminal domain-containing protein [Bacteroidota bacterium]